MSNGRQPPKEQNYILSILRRPLEVLLFGVILLGVVHLLARNDLLPEVAEGLGFKFQWPKQLAEEIADTGGSVEDLRLQIQEMNAEIEALQEALRAEDISFKTDEIGRINDNLSTVEPTVQVAPQPVREDLASRSTNLLSDETRTGDGVMWIGTYDPDTDRWEQVNFLVRGKAITPAPSGLWGESIEILLNTNIRDGFPTDDERYYRSANRIGVVSQNTVVSVMGDIRVFERENGGQVWVEVRGTYRPYISNF